MKTRTQRATKLFIIAVLIAVIVVLVGCGTSSHSSSHSSSMNVGNAINTVTSTGASNASGHTTSNSVPATNVQNAQPAIPDGAISWQQASNHIGEVVKIFGPVKSTKYASTSNGSPTFLDLGATYPNTSRVTITIWGRNRSAFSNAPEKLYSGKTLCVTGEVYLYKGVCNIEVTSPSQITVL